MTLLLAFIVFGFLGGLMVNSFMGNRSSLGGAWSVGLGLVGSFAFGMFFVMFGKTIVGEGPEFLAALAAGVVGAVVLPLVGALVKK